MTKILVEPPKVTEAFPATALQPAPQSGELNGHVVTVQRGAPKVYVYVQGVCEEPVLLHEMFKKDINGDVNIVLDISDLLSSVLVK